MRGRSGVQAWGLRGAWGFGVGGLGFRDPRQKRIWSRGLEVWGFRVEGARGLRGLGLRGSEVWGFRVDGVFGGLGFRGCEVWVFRVDAGFSFRFEGLESFRAGRSGSEDLRVHTCTHTHTHNMICCPC